MAPIHESDVDEKRFHSSEWNTYEFWEKVEARLVWRRRLWFFFAALVFVLIAAIPVFKDTLPKWKAMAVVRRLGNEVSRIKREAGSEGQAFGLEFTGKGLEYQVFKSASCDSAKPVVVRTGNFAVGGNAEELSLLPPADGGKMGFQTLTTKFCFDPLQGATQALRGYESIGFGVLPAKDLTDFRQDRMVFLILSGPSAQITFE